MAGTIESKASIAAFLGTSANIAHNIKHDKKIHIDQLHRGC
ncbi:hypothetical protein CPter91_4073 [Collimonas pratensis]|uniref:Uncharacterized protein n=1 Tax=Collimonas pratensis TaxID=279113 RepID=A0A127Q8M3_9BURK|nr:hypothetical protein CPter91_4073 [Collimonas pratensis]